MAGGSATPDRYPWPVDESLSRRVRVARLAAGWLPVVAWAALIFAFSAQPSLTFVPDQALDLVVRKLGHMGIFGILALLAWRAVVTSTTWRPAWAWALGLTVAYALTDELHQALTAERHPSLVDVAIDAAGAALALAGLAAVRSWRWRARRGT